MTAQFATSNADRQRRGVSWTALCIFPFHSSFHEIAMRPICKCSQRWRIHKGVKRVELAVSFLVLLLMALLLAPSMNLSRESARQSQCSTNLGRLGRALQEYHATYKRLPLAATWEAEGILLDDFPAKVDTTPVTHMNWAVTLLPYLEEQKLQSLFSAKYAMISAENERARSTSVAVMNCPSDSYNQPSNLFIYGSNGGKRSAFARGNYAINGGPQGIEEKHGHLMVPRPYGCTVIVDLVGREIQWWGEGIAGFNKSFSFDEFRNGLGKTVAFNELRAGISPGDQRGAWALGQIASSVTWAHGILGDAGRPNPTLANADDILNGTALHPTIGRERIEREGMTFCDHCEISYQASSRSQHPGGVNLVFCDGATSFVINEVDASIWNALHSRNTPGEMVSSVSKASLISNEESKLRKEINSTRPRRPRAYSHETLINSQQMQFKLILPGSFTMGLPDKGAIDNYPENAAPHSVTISAPFYMGHCEVTQSQFERIMGHNPSFFTSASSGQWEVADEEISERPVENLTWHEAVSFCRRLSAVPAERDAGRTYRLPTEAEWEYCCRSGSSSPYAFVPQWSETDRSGEITGKQWREDIPPTLPVGSYPANPFGLHDMRGNVWEWCNDWFRHDYYSWGRTTDPPGPADGMLKVYRGGDWIYTGESCKTGCRCLPSSSSSPLIGFRIVCELNR